MQKQKVIENNLFKYRNKKINIINKKLRKLLKNRVILFCGGRDGIVALKILTNLGAKIPIIIDNNSKFSGKKIDKATIKTPSYLKKNLNKLSKHKILICINNINLANMIKLQLNKIGIKDQNISYFNV